MIEVHLFNAKMKNKLKNEISKTCVEEALTNTGEKLLRCVFKRLKRTFKHPLHERTWTAQHWKVVCTSNLCNLLIKYFNFSLPPHDPFSLEATWSKALEEVINILMLTAGQMSYKSLHKYIEKHENRDKFTILKNNAENFFFYHLNVAFQFNIYTWFLRCSYKQSIDREHLSITTKKSFSFLRFLKHCSIRIRQKRNA